MGIRSITQCLLRYYASDWRKFLSLTRAKYSSTIQVLHSPILGYGMSAPLVGPFAVLDKVCQNISQKK